jgi:murein DD-endopeptidase MepM/ murein hydrolase activator NlpD
MGHRDGFSDSFDPRSWTGGNLSGDTGGAAPAARDPADPSFDPKTWAVADATGDAPIRDSEPAAAPSRRLGLAVAAGAAIFVAGAAGTWLFRPPPQAASPAASATAAAVSPTKAVSAAPAGSERTLILPGSGAILDALTRAGIDEASARAASEQALGLLGAAPGEIRLAFAIAETARGGHLAWLEATRPDGSGARVIPTEAGFRGEPLAARLTLRVRAVPGEMDDDSFYTSAVTAGVTDSLISDFAAAFGYDLNFQSDVRRGDRFEAVIEQAENPAGEAVGSPRLLFVSMRTAEKSLRYYRFTPPGGEEGWFDDNGRGNRRSLMRTPLDGARITSRFGPRFHPVLHFVRLHGGTDFAAPVGTRVYAAAGGVVQSAGRSGCAGNMIVLRHDNGWQTRYFHLSAFAPNVTAGARVEQGDVIGAVGNTGTCTTGPHLHYEVHINGEKVDPLSVPTGGGTTLQGPALQAFRAARDRIDRSRGTGSSGA